MNVPFNLNHINVPFHLNNINVPFNLNNINVPFNLNHINVPFDLNRRNRWIWVILFLPVIQFPFGSDWSELCVCWTNRRQQYMTFTQDHSASWRLSGFWCHVWRRSVWNPASFINAVESTWEGIRLHRYGRWPTVYVSPVDTQKLLCCGSLTDRHL